MDLNIRKNLIRLFEDAQKQTKNFKKESYQNSFGKYYEEYEEFCTEINKLIEEADNKETFTNETAGIIPGYVKEKLAEIDKKSRKKKLILDYNFALVTYVLPVINYSREENNKALSDAIVREWNKDISETPIKNADYEQIYSGFDQRLCYITTAACQSQRKPDDCYELQLLRDYRDHYLAGQKQGKELVEEYYNIAPTIVKRINKLDDAENVYMEIWTDYLVPCIQLIEQKRLDECRDVYSNMVQNLRKKYLYS